MKTVLRTFFLFLFFFSFCIKSVEAKIKFDWTESGSTKNERIAVEACFRRVAEVYKNDSRYCPLGSIDFYATKDEYAVTFWDKTLAERETVNQGGSGGDSALQLSPKILRNLPLLEEVISHEMSHWYDISMLNKRGSLPKGYMLAGEPRSIQNEDRYLREVMKSRLSAEVYAKLRVGLDEAMTAHGVR